MCPWKCPECARVDTFPLKGKSKIKIFNGEVKSMVNVLFFK